MFLLALGLLLFWVKDRQNLVTDRTAAARTRATQSAHNSPEAELRRTSSSRSTLRPAPEGILTSHKPEQLKDFYLIKCSGHKVSLHTALNLLDESYHDACYYSLEKTLDIKYSVEEPSAKLISFCIKGKKWLNALEYIAALAGMEAQHDGLVVRLVRHKLDSPLKRSYEIPIYAQESLLQELIDRGEWDDQVEKPDIVTLLRLHGLLGTAELSGSLFADNIIINGTEGDTVALTALLNMGDDKPQYFINHSKIIISSTPLDLPQGALTEEDTQKWIRELVAKDGIQVMSSPSATTRSGNAVNIEVKEERGGDWTGMQFTYLTQPIGLKLSTESKTEIRPVDQTHNHQRSEDRLVMYAGDTQIKSIGHDAGGYYYQMTSVMNVPQMGREEFSRDTVSQTMNHSDRAAEQPIANSVPGKPGFVFSPYTNHIVDVRDLQQGTLVADPHFSTQEKKFFRVP